MSPLGFSGGSQLTKTVSELMAEAFIFLGELGISEAVVQITLWLLTPTPTLVKAETLM